MQIKIKITDAEIKAGAVGSTIQVSPARARRWCEKGKAVLVDDRFELSQLPARAELDAEWIAKQTNAKKPEPVIETGKDGGKVDSNPVGEDDKKETKIETDKDAPKSKKKKAE